MVSGASGATAKHVQPDTLVSRSSALQEHAQAAAASGALLCCRVLLQIPGGHKRAPVRPVLKGAHQNTWPALTQHCQNVQQKQLHMSGSSCQHYGALWATAQGCTTACGTPAPAADAPFSSSPPEKQLVTLPTLAARCLSGLTGRHTCLSNFCPCGHHTPHSGVACCAPAIQTSGDRRQRFASAAAMQHLGHLEAFSSSGHHLSRGGLACWAPLLQVPTRSLKFLVVSRLLPCSQRALLPPPGATPNCTPSYLAAAARLRRAACSSTARADRVAASGDAWDVLSSAAVAPIENPLPCVACPRLHSVRLDTSVR